MVDKIRISGVSLIVFLVGAALFIGCIQHILADKNYAGPLMLGVTDRDYYTYTTNFENYEERLIGTYDHYVKRRIEFDLPQAANEMDGKVWRIKMDYYDVLRKEPTPIILVLPPLGGGDEVTDFFASYFAEHGYAALVVHRNGEQDNIADLEKIEIALRQTIVTQMLALDWVMTRKELDGQKIGVFGVSMGGIKGAILAGVDDRISAAVLALAGADLPYILAHSTEEDIARKRAEIMRKYRVGPDDLERALRGRIKTDPARYAANIDARMVLLILANQDSVVPIEKGEELARLIGYPERIYLPTGHYSAIIYIFYARAAALEFFDRKFNGR